MLWLLALGCGPAVEFSSRERNAILELGPLEEPEPDPTNAVDGDPDAVALGQSLYFSPGLSSNGEISCATCHQPDEGLSDGLQLSEAIGVTGRHAPTVFASGHQRWFFWDGRADTLWVQALGPIENDQEMDLSRVEAVRVVADSPELAELYVELFGPFPDMAAWPERAMPVPNDPDSEANIAWEAMAAEEREDANRAFSNLGKAIAAYERLLVPYGAPFDDFVEGLRTDDLELQDAISDEAKRGAQIFAGEGNCTQCHSGPMLSDKSFHNVGLGGRDWLDPDDRGRWDVIDTLPDNEFSGISVYSDDPDFAALKFETLAQNDEFLGGFKTPTLRNVAESAPYMHGGHFPDLAEVVTHYNEIREMPEHGHREEILLPMELSPDDQAALVAFLESLTGTVDPALMD